MSAGNDDFVLLYIFMFCLAGVEHERANEVSYLPTL